MTCQDGLVVLGVYTSVSTHGTDSKIFCKIVLVVEYDICYNFHVDSV